MPTITDQRRTLLDPWVDLLPRDGASKNSTRAQSAAGDGHGLHPTKSEIRRLRRKQDGRFRNRDELGTNARTLDKYEASLAGSRNQPGKPGIPAPAMDIWAAALGVDIQYSKATERARRKIELEEAGLSTDPGGWASSVPPTTAPDQLSPSRSRKRGRDALGVGTAGGRRRPIVPEVAALDGFLAELQGRLKSVEGGAVGAGGATVVPTPAASVIGVGDRGGGRSALSKRAAARAGVGGEYGGDGESSSASLADVYGIPKAFIANAKEVRGGRAFGHPKRFLTRGC